MSYPGPPGVSANASHHSLPARPPPAKNSGFKPAFTPSASLPAATSAVAYVPTPSYSGAPGYAAPGVPGGYGAPPSVSPYVANPPSAIGGARGGYNTQTNTYGYAPQQPQPHQQLQHQQHGYQQQPAYYGAGNTGNTNFASAPQIRNPFPAPNTQAAVSAADFDPEMAAQVAQWQSAYMPKDPNDPTTKGPGGAAAAGAAAAGGWAGARSAAGAYAPAAQIGVAPTEPVDHSAGVAGATGDEKKKTVYREGGGKKWQDDSLLEWDPSHLRLFVGNLAGETTDESLLKAFSRWKSVQKAKVVRDKRTTKSKGFGFVSFSDPDDFFQAAKEMNGKYIQSHPVVVHKAKTEVKPVVVKDDRKGGKHHKKGGGGGGKKSGSGAGGQDGAPYEPHLGAMGGGVTKPGQKTRGGLKLLG
ncbi:hypothetical protein B0T22DRAFT_453381 [Podospora appendiculata]|uniref:RRM domain-containing protein n=1 Tax=Podospora appendiculata TaxID=314037 RepID=A0AAE1CHQ2_9PEZI|nr:hypothetical protein B0T22DRAFT_453381 [Podospora appendiculata]